MAVQYLNVDLEIEGPRPLGHILQEFSESGISCLGCFETRRGHFANFEVTALPSDANSIVSEFCDAIEGFREDAEATWAGAHRRTFDMGLDSDGSAGCSRFELKADTVRRAAELGASLGITIYSLSDTPVEFGSPPDEETRNGSTVHRRPA
ncbi:MAG: hypothetical protein OXC31_23295 [Spirochaetaceae bacterium]|nr:hypothetical protein [Spirochaetaceae bacterium]